MRPKKLLADLLPVEITNPGPGDVLQLKEGKVILYHLCGPACMEPHMPTHLQEEETDISAVHGRCPVRDRPCEYGCEMECYLEGMTPEQVAKYEMEAATETGEDERRN